MIKIIPNELCNLKKISAISYNILFVQKIIVKINQDLSIHISSVVKVEEESSDKQN